MDRYDIAIIGAGPAGVSAAITAKVRSKSVLLIGSKALSEKIYKAHQINNYPGFPQISGQKLTEAFQAHLQQMDIPVTEKRVNAIYAMGDYFAIQASEDIYEARTVILATGVVQGKTLPGEKELLGCGVSYCATCDGQFYRGKTVAVIGYGRDAEAETAFLAELAKNVLYFPMYKETPQLPENVRIVRERPLGIAGAQRVEKLQTDGNVYAVDGVFVLRDSIAPQDLIAGLQMDGAHAAVNLRMETNIPGCFACGDIAGMPYQYVKAAGQGNIAALSAVSYLAKS